MASIGLGKLKAVDLREVWKSESQEFTPWLAQEENLKLLGETIGLELQLEALEKQVGAFWADILCKDLETDNWVLIENQLDKTDHKHLGQIITYAAGLNAKTLIWIADHITEDHRAAIDWLNQNTISGLNFFAIEIELWQIGNSEIAPKFNLVSKPNNWSKTVSEGAGNLHSGENSVTKQTQLEFWGAFHDYVKSNSKIIRPTKPLPQHWMNIAIGKSGFKLTAIASFYSSSENSYANHEVRVEFVIDSDESKEIFAKMVAQKSEIELAVKEPLIWYSTDSVRNCRIYLSRPTDLNDRNSWSGNHVWMLERLESFYRVFQPIIRAI